MPADAEEEERDSEADEDVLAAGLEVDDASAADVVEDMATQEKEERSKGERTERI